MHAYERAQEHLELARVQCEAAEQATDETQTAQACALATMHYLGYLAETEWSKDTASDVEGVPDR